MKEKWKTGFLREKKHSIDDRFEDIEPAREFEMKKSFQEMAKQAGYSNIYTRNII